jgi:hypothetical protein
MESLKKREYTLFVSALFLLLLFSCGAKQESTAADPVDVLKAPVQEMLATPTVVKFSNKGYEGTITLKASYVVRGIVVGHEKYSSGWQSAISPYDLALCWGELTRNNLYKKLSWSQRGRWYYWRYGSDFGYDNSLVIPNSSNNHIIPAKPALAGVIGNLSVGKKVEIEGFLADVRANNKEGRKFWWNSSTSRTDTADGSCEIIYVTSVTVDGRRYE